MDTTISESFFTEGATIAWKKGVNEKFEIAEKDGTLQTKEGPQNYKAGYRILTGPQGEKYSMPKETFDKLKVDNGDGTATPVKIPKLAKLADSDGQVKTSWGETLQYRAKEDYIVRHGKGDYGVVKAEIFKQTYQTEQQDAPSKTETKEPLTKVEQDRAKAVSFARGLARGLLTEARHAPSYLPTKTAGGI
jgi:hypothetical protein